MDLTTTYLGLTLKSPLIVGAAAPLTEKLEYLPVLEQAGAAAIVLHSLFEEQLEQESSTLHFHLEQGIDSFAEALSYFPEPQIYPVGPQLYLDHLKRAKELVSVPIIASLNGDTLGGWLDFACQIEAAGADALELNLYSLPTDPDVSAAEIEDEYVQIVRTVCEEIRIPLAVKLSPFFTNPANLAKRLQQVGADGLVLFNRFYQPDIDIETLEVVPRLLLSTPLEQRLPMHWLALLYERVPLDLAATSGIQHGTDVVKMLMAGATTVQIVGALLRHGAEQLRVIEQELVEWLQAHEYESLAQLRGSMSLVRCPDPHHFERVQYIRSLETYQPQWHVVNQR
jgi:dihydroorotate dehydrogenase (fumarate)